MISDVFIQQITAAGSSLGAAGSISFPVLRIIHTRLGTPVFRGNAGIETETPGSVSRLFLIADPGSQCPGTGRKIEDIQQMIPALRTLTGMILRPGKIGKVAIGGNGPATAWRPRSPHIHAVFILHAASLGKAVAEQGIVSGRIEPLHSREREMVGKLIRSSIERGDGSTITRCRFATYRPAMGNIP